MLQKKKISFFYIAYFLFLFSWIFESFISNNMIIKTVRYISYFLFVLIIVIDYQKINIKELILKVLFTLIIIYSSSLIGDKAMLPLWLLILSCKKYDFNKFVKIDFAIKLTFLTFIIILYYLGITEHKVFYNYDGIVRNSFGFNSPNSFGQYVFSVCADYLYIIKGNIKLKHVIILFFVSSFVAITSYSRTAFILIFSLPVLIYLYEKFKLKILVKKSTKVILCLIFFLLTIFSFVFCKNYDSSSKMYSELNHITSGRIAISQKYIEEYNPKIMGQVVGIQKYNSTSDYYIDNAYIRLLLNYGIIIYIFIAVIEIKSIKNGFKNKNERLLLILIIYMLCGLLENALISPTMNSFLIVSFMKKNS